MAGVIVSILFVTAVHTAEPKLVKSSEVPPVLQKSVATLGHGSEAKYFRFDSDSSKVIWRIEFQEQNQKRTFLIETRETVSNGKTNVAIIRADPIRPKQ
jgi:hypothetical protein